MKQALVILVLSTFSYIQLYNGLIWLNYKVNKTEIIQAFCENKDKPEMKCEGTCHMKKMMINEDDGEQDQKPVIIPEFLLYVSLFPIEVLNQEIEIKLDYFHRVSYCAGFSEELDPPPRA
ncbi:MAG: hypothetical protein RIE58_12710 [Vicingaceae bacterium]